MTESYEETLARWAAQEVQRKDQAKAKLRELLERLRSLGVTSVHAEYNGYGDEGQIEHLAFEPEGIAIPKEIEQETEDACDALCPDGYENNDGGYGSISIDVTTGRIEHEHNDCHTEVDTTEEAYEI